VTLDWRHRAGSRALAWKVRTIPSHPNKRQALLACRAIEIEHRALFDFIDDMRDTIDAGERDVLTRSLRDFQGKVKAHFRHEEEIMRLYGYPDFESHRSQHADLVRTLEEGIGTDQAGKPVKVFLQVFNHLTEELHHCVAADVHLTTYLQEL
jgi:hemerythrin